MQKKDMPSTATARSNVYGFLARIYRAEVDASFLHRLKEPGVAGVFKDLGVSLGKEFTNSPDEQLIEDLAIEYTRLFIGPRPGALPYESIHADPGKPKNHELYGPQTIKVKRFIEETGLEYDDNFSGLPDHISVELEFMQKMADKEAQAWTAGDDELATDILKIEKRFYDQHLSRWIPEFCGKVIDMCKLPFYREMAAVTECFLEYESKNLAFAAAAPSQ